MVKFLKSVLVLALALIGISGCKDVPQEESSLRSSNTYAVVVGMDKSAFAGECPGAAYDAKRMYALLSRYTANIKLLVNEDATKAAVTRAITNGIKDGDLFIFFYSGHGGSEAFPDTGVEEDDGMDEFYCFYDTYMRDNDMWEMISESKGRVVLINDCCHSRTIFRSPSISLKSSMGLAAENGQDIQFSLLCWSGCPDNTYSYGSSTGGKFTNTLIKHFNSSYSYEYLWGLISRDDALLKFETPQETIIGEGFTSRQVFR